MSTQVPPMLAGLIDDAAVFPPGNAPLPDALAGHRRHRDAWYADLVGPLLLPAADVDRLATLLAADEPGRAADRAPEPLDLGLIGALGTLTAALDRTPAAVRVRQVESPVAKRGEDPVPGLRALIRWLADRAPLRGYAEIPLAWGLHDALDAVAEARASGLAVAAKFRTGGLAAELFPSPQELAAVICACRERDLPFKLTAGLHHAVRHTERSTGFTHHGFVNVLAATVAAADGAGVPDVAEVLTDTDRDRLVGKVRPALDRPRPLWVGYGSCSIDEPLADLRGLGLLDRYGDDGDHGDDNDHSDDTDGVRR